MRIYRIMGTSWSAYFYLVYPYGREGATRRDGVSGLRGGKAG